MLHHERPEQHRRDDGHGIGLEEIRRHAGAVADIVADVVGDHRRVTRIVLRYARLDFAHKVGAHVGALGKDAAAKAREDRDQRSTESEPHQRVNGMREVRFIDGIGIEQREIPGHAEQAQPHDQKTGNRAAVEGDLQCLVQPDARRFRGANIGTHRYVHADDAAGTGEDCAEKEAPRGRPTQSRHEADHQEQDHADDGDGLVLAPQVGVGAFAYRGGDLAHALVAIGQAKDARDLPDPVDDGENRASQREHETALHILLPFEPYGRIF
jgi:hypothetical protein